jgi:PhzF family phenazine biosynthesis protein
MARRFQQVDVFTDVPTRGNPVAVVIDGDGLDEEAMRALAAWTNLSETTFLLPPRDAAADYRVRILTPDGELPFAGHPTLGSAHAWLAAGGRPKGERVVQECEVGLVELRRDAGRLAFAAPPLRASEVPPALLEAALSALGLRADQVVRSQLLVNGPSWLTIEVPDVATVLALEPDHPAMQELPEVGVLARYPDGAECAIEVRGFAACIGVPEDPVTGSLNAGIAQWLIGAGILPGRYVAAQGTRLGRVGRAHLEAADGEVWVGGATHTVVDGTVNLFDTD